MSQPAHAQGPPSPARPWSVVRLLGFLCGGVFVSLVLYNFALPRAKDLARWRDRAPELPPVFLTVAEVEAFEDALPQHNLSRADPAASVRYVRFANQQAWNAGLNNMWQETVVLAHLALLSRHAYVFSRVQDASDDPMNVYWVGPAAGGPWPWRLRDAPRSVNVKFWEAVCPPERRTLLRGDGLGLGVRAGGREIMETWSTVLGAMPDPCVEIVEGSPAIFSLWLCVHAQTGYGADDCRSWFESESIGSIWPELRESPVLRGMQWSGAVYAAVARNMPLLFSHATRRDTLPIAAIHVRRGDFLEHCPKLVRMNATFASWNTLPDVEDRFVPGNEEHTLARCWPSVGQIVSTLREVASKHFPRLRRVFVMTKAQNDEVFVGQLLAALRADGWSHVVTSDDLDLRGEVEHVANAAIDMEIARRAASIL